MGDGAGADTVPSVAPRQVDDTEVSSIVKPPQPPPEFLGDLTELPCFCTALTLAATALTVALPMILRDQLPPCREPRCFEYAREMALSVDPGTDPCDDFFSHVCGNFEDLYPRYSSLLSVLGTRVSQYQDSVLNRLELSSSMETPGEVTVAAFRVCVEEYRSGYDGGLRAIRDLLWELGLYLRAKKVTYTVENVFEGMLRMSLSFDLPVLVRAVLVRSLKETAHNKLELQLDLHMPVAPVERTIDNIEYSLRAVAQNGTFSRFHHLASTVFGSLKRLQSRLASLPPWNGGMKYVRFADVRDTLLSFTTTERLLEIANDAVSVEGYFESDSELATANPEHLRGFSVFAVEQDGGRLLNLVRYLLVERLLPVSFYGLADIYNVTVKEAFGIRVTACRREAVGLTPRAWADLIFRNLLGLNYSAAEVVAYDVLHSAIAQVSSEGVWTVDTETSERAKQRLEMTRLLLGRVAVKDNFRVRYGHVKAPNASKPFVAWLLRTLQLGCKQLAAALSRDSATLYVDTYDPEQRVLNSNPNAVLDPVRLDIMVTPAMLFAPFLVEDAPVAVNYGAIGGIVGSLLAQSLDPAVSAYGILGRRMEQSWFSEASLNARKDTLSCISTNMETYLKDSLSYDHATEVLAYTMGLRFAHAAFVRKLDDNDTLTAAGEWDGPFLSGSDVRGLNRLFFAASCFQLCGVSLPRGVATSALPLRHRCNMPLMNYAEFGRTFGCPAHSAMVATNSCFPEP